MSVWFVATSRSGARCLAAIAGAMLLLAGAFADAQETSEASETLRAQPAEDATVSEKLRFAEGLLSRGFYDMAEEEFREFLGQHPENQRAPAAMFGLIQARRAQNKMNAVVEAIRTFQERWPHHELGPKLYLWLGETLVQQGKLTAAEEAFKRLLDEPDSVIREAALYFIAQSTMERGRTQKALALYRTLAEKPLDSKHQYRPYAVYAIGAHAQQRGDAATARKMFGRLADETDQVPRALQEEALFRLAQTQFSEGKYAEAIVQYESLLVEFPEGRFAREARKRRLWAHYQLSHYERAMELAAQWVERYAGEAEYEVVFIQAASHLAKEQYQKAQDLFGRLGMLAEVPPVYRRSARYHQIFCAVMLSRHEEVREMAAAFLADFPDVAAARDVRFFQAKAACETEEFAVAVPPLQELVAQYSLDWEYWPDAVDMLAKALGELGRGGERAAVLRKAAEKGGKWAPEWLLRAAEAERRNGNRTAAIRTLESVLKKYPDSRDEAVAATLYLAELYSIEQDFDRAQELVRDLLRGEETQAIKGRLHYLLGYICGNQQRYEAAEKELRAALESGASADVVADAKNYLVFVLLRQDKTEEALSLFGDVLEMPLEARPDMDPTLLFELERIYYTRNQYGVSRVICEWLRSFPAADVRFKAGLRLAELHIATKNLEEARTLLEALREEQLQAKAEGLKKAGVRLGAVTSLLGEVAMMSGERDVAVSAFEEALDGNPMSQEISARSRWGLASILHEEGRHEQALDYAMNAFILNDDPVYTPRAMFKAVAILLDLGRTQEARMTWQEMKARYPAFSARKQQAETIMQLGKKLDGEGNQGGGEADGPNGGGVADE